MAQAQRMIGIYIACVGVTGASHPMPTGTSSNPTA